MNTRRALSIAGATLLAGCLACGEDPAPEAAAKAAPAPAAKKARKGEAAEEPKLPPPPLPSGPIDFSEAARWRDPFASYAGEFAREAKKRVKSQREVLLDQYTLDE